MSKDTDRERRSGLLVLLTVPVAWGTFEPAVRYLYTIDPPIPGFVFSTCYYLVASSSLYLACFLSQTKKSDGNKSLEVSQPWPIQGGLELGSYLFVGNALQVIGLQTVPSDRAAFLLQLTTIFVPLLDATLARNLYAIPGRTWMACWIALAGVATMGLDRSNTSDSFQNLEPSLGILNDVLSQLSGGDAFIVAAAIAYTFHCLRLESYAQSTSAVQLAASKATTETVLSAASVAGLIWYSSSTGYDKLSVEELKTHSDHLNSLASFARQTGQEIVKFLSSVENGIASGSVSFATLRPALLATLWTGLVTVAYTIYAQSYGQSRIRPVTANLIYTIQPICTALFAWFLLGESLGPAGYAGGALIGAAVLLVALPNGTDTSNRTTDASTLDS
jgi:drug/metabolite transporter (DMT)-like permease